MIRTNKKLFKELIGFYRDNPVIAAYDLLNVELADVQGVILESMWFTPYNLITAGRGAGKSFLLSVYACLQGLLYSESRVGIVSSSFRQARTTFTEVKYRWEGSPLLREAVLKKPTFGADMCYMEFKKKENSKPSVIYALPIGDGSKIRGMRFYSLLLDEMAQIPEDIIDMVLKPMGATSANPMERVKRVKKLKELEKAGIKEAGEFLKEDAINKFIGCSSAFFTFNHMYKRIQNYRENLNEGSDKHGLFFVSYKDMPDGFLDENNIKEAKQSMAKTLFDMEYGGIWQKDSDGVFKASLIEECKDFNCPVLCSGSSGFNYIMGIDPARSSADFAITILELRNGFANLVYAFRDTDNTFPQMADKIFTLSKLFPVSLIVLDSGAGGGGMALKDILEDKSKYGDETILDMDDPELQETRGRKILRMFVPSSKANAEAVYSSVNLLEQKKLHLPYPPQKGDLEQDQIYENIASLYKQLMCINVSETRSGVAHFDVAGKSRVGGKKDLFSSFIMAANEYHKEVYYSDDEESEFYNLNPVVKYNN